jgi:hypothetical protein
MHPEGERADERRVRSANRGLSLSPWTSWHLSRFERSPEFSEQSGNRSLGAEYLAMAQTGQQDLGWAQGWGVVRLVLEKLQFIAFFEAREDAEAAASEVGADC